MNICKLTEQEIVDFLLADTKEVGVLAPRVVVTQRIAKENSITRIVRFALIVPINNELLIDKLITNSVARNQPYYFVGSEVNLQSESMELDYLFFEAKILSKR